MKSFKYYLKNCFIFYVYLLIMMITALAIAAIENMLWLQIILSVLNIGLFSFIMFTMCKKTGEDAYKLKHTNDIKRRVIMQTGDYYNFDTVSEYGKYKGLYIGIYTAAPLIIMLLLHLIIGFFGVRASALEVACAFTYGMFVFPVKIINANASIYWSVYAVIILVLIAWAGYGAGAIKMQRQYAKIQKTNEQIYGKK